MSEEDKRPEYAEQTGAEASAGEAEQPEPETAENAGEEFQYQLEEARNKAEEHWNQLLRIQAELENTHRRAERDVEQAHKFALEKFVGELLPVKDSLELGLGAADDAGDDGDTVAKLKEGVELTLKMFSGALEKFGVQEINPAGEPFNPEHHQAMTMQESSEVEPNTVMTVMQKGYLLNDRLVRPAMVVVSKAPSEEAGS